MSIRYRAREFIRIRGGLYYDPDTNELLRKVAGSVDGDYNYDSDEVAEDYASESDHVDHESSSSQEPLQLNNSNVTVGHIAFRMIASAGANGVLKSQLSDYLIKGHSRLLIKENGELSNPLRNLSNSIIYEEFMIKGKPGRRIRLAQFSGQGTTDRRQVVIKIPTSLVAEIRNFLTPFGSNGTFSSQVAEYLLKNHRNLLNKENIGLAPSWSTRLFKKYDQHFVLFHRDRDNVPFLRNRIEPGSHAPESSSNRNASREGYNHTILAEINTNPPSNNPNTKRSSVHDIAFEFIATHGSAGVRKSQVSDYLIRNHSRVLMKENGDLGTPLRNLSGEMFEEFMLGGEKSTRMIRLARFGIQHKNTSAQASRQEVTRSPRLVDVIRNFLDPFGNKGTFSSQVADHLLRNHRDLLIKENVDLPHSWSTRLLEQYAEHFELFRRERNFLFVRNRIIHHTRLGCCAEDVSSDRKPLNNASSLPSMKNTQPSQNKPNSILKWHPLQIHSTKRVRYTILTDILECQQAFKTLNISGTTIAIDCEGVRLNRYGQLCLLTISTESSTSKGFQSDVYIVDFLNFHLNQIKYKAHRPEIPVELLADSGLRKLLENPNIVKLVHDCRNDAAALFFQARIRLQGVFDTQLAVCEAEGHDRRMRLAEVIEKYTDFEHKSKSTIKDQMSEDPRYWLRRPLSADNIRYMIEDVVHLFDIRQFLVENELTHSEIKAVAIESESDIIKKTKRN